MKNTLQFQLVELFKSAILEAFPGLIGADTLQIDLTQSTQEKFGHYQCNMAMKLAKLVSKNPRQVALAIVEHLPKSGLIEKVEIEGPGFINITLNPKILALGLSKMVQDERLGISSPSPRERICIDFSSPNIAKEMHVGHLRSTIIGDSIARVFEFLGHDVLRLNHIGDFGTSFGMLIAYLKLHAPKVISGEAPCTLSDLVVWYKLSKKLFDEDPGFKKEAQLEVVALQGGEEEAVAIWKRICLISEEAYQKIYDLLDISIIERGESFYKPLLPGLVKELEEKGLVTLSDGAKCIFLEGFQNREGEALPLMIQKSDGGYNYGTTDMAALKHRIEEEKADRIIYVIDQGQSTHLQMVFKASEKAGYLDPKKVRVDHVGFGLVLGQDGKKLKTRAGDTPKLSELLDTAIEEAKKILLERNPEIKSDLLEEEAQVLGIGAVKYSDLSTNRISDYCFSYEKMLRFEGNTAAFILYSYVRTLGIKRKIGIEKLDKSAQIILSHPSEISLGVHLMQFSETLEKITNELLPSRLTEYLYTLAEKFNQFFRDCRVEGSDEQSSRLLLTEATGLTLKKGLELLGIKTLEKM